MKTLGLQRLFAMGDSLQYMAMISLSHLLGMERIKSLHRHLQVPLNARSIQTLTCSDGYKIELAFYRSNHLWPILAGNVSDANIQDDRRKASKARIAQEHDLKYDKKPVEYFICNAPLHALYPDEKGNCPWVYDYLANTAPTLLWTGVGAHLHFGRIFLEGLNHFEGFLRQHQRPHDLVLLRTLHPGHSGCGDVMDPYRSFQSYLVQGQTKQYDWHKFAYYNQMMEERAWKISRDVEWKGAAIDIHDIYWMTALRKDGHPSRKDCLHYLLPGPSDWWSHTLSSRLRDLADAKERLTKGISATVPENISQHQTQL
jgi:hypothetical protein